jgi:hypothetical protein
MREPMERHIGRVTRVHPYQWLWEPLEPDPTFVLRTMFGAKAVYLDGKLVLCFCAGEEPWRGVLIGTDRTRHAALRADFPEFAPHPVLSKWLYLPESADNFERAAQRLVTLVRQRDPRIGVDPRPKKRGTARKPGSARARKPPRLRA